MSRQIEQTLFSLMPSYGSDLPPSLVELAGSLLAQSRLKASTLKAEEEVARIYACANLACDR
jgi:origin recognition complex subunit 6